MTSRTPIVLSTVFRASIMPWSLKTKGAQSINCGMDYEASHYKTWRNKILTAIRYDRTASRLTSFDTALIDSTLSSASISFLAWCVRWSFERESLSASAVSCAPATTASNPVDVWVDTSTKVSSSSFSSSSISSSSISAPAALDPAEEPEN